MAGHLLISLVSGLLVTMAFVQKGPVSIKRLIWTAVLTVAAVASLPILFLSIPITIILVGDFLMLPIFVDARISLARQFGELQSARDLWDENAPSRYVIHMDFTDGFGSCEQKLEVQGNQVTNVMSNTCHKLVRFAAENRTVEDLFREIELTHTEPKCGGNGCYCDGVYNYSVTYDERMGFPIEVKSRFRMSLVALAGQGLFVFMGPSRTCTLVGALHPQVTVSVTPLA